MSCGGRAQGRPHGEGALTPGDRLVVRPAATRALGEDLLLVAVPGPEQPVEEITGSGAVVWSLLARGLTLEDTAAELARQTGAEVAEVREHVLAFARSLLDRGLADPR